LTFFAIEQKKEADAAPIIEYLNGVVKEPEGLKTACATVYARSGRPDRAEMLLREILAEKPDYEYAHLALAANLLLQKKAGADLLLGRLLATNMNPAFREQAAELLEIKSTLDFVV
jgi:hypothetical protein